MRGFCVKQLIVIFLCILMTHKVTADELQWSDLLPERLILDEQHVYAISSFQGISYLTAYTYSGDLAWEVNFQTQIISSGIAQGRFFIFSQAIDRGLYFLTCVDAGDGKFLWEKKIWAPLPQEDYEALFISQPPAEQETPLETP
jgi:outer membrane protein assembly factor BamB